MRAAICACALCLPLSLAIGAPQPGTWRGMEYGAILQEVRTGTSNRVELQQTGTRPIVYRVWGVWGFAHHLGPASEVALDFGHYPAVFGNVYRCERVTAPRRSMGRHGTWYLEGRAAMARIWCIGNIDSLSVDSGQVLLLAAQNENRSLDSAWRQVLPGWVNFRTWQLRLAAFIVPRGADSCRVGVMAQGVVSRRMPQWLCSLALQVILPRILKDFDQELTARERRRAWRGQAPARSH